MDAPVDERARADAEARLRCSVHGSRKETTCRFELGRRKMRYALSTPRSAVSLPGRFEVLLPHLNERQQRLALATEARLLGHGGVRAVAEASGVSATTVRKGVAELESGEDPLPVGRARRAGGGRKRADRARSGAGERPCSGWSNRMSAAIRCPRCGGRPSRCGTWPTSWPGRAIRCPRRRWGGCCATTGSACKERPRRWRARSTRIGTPSSPTSTSRSRPTRLPVSR